MAHSYNHNQRKQTPIAAADSHHDKQESIASLTPPPLRVTAGPVIQNKEEEEKSKALQKKEPTTTFSKDNDSPPVGESTPFQLKNSGANQRSEGQLPKGVQAKMENSFGHDFSNINIHANSQNAVQLKALAYAQGNDVHFAPGQFKPNTTGGQELIGHELAHVVQQREGRVKPTVQTKGVAINDSPALEKEADVMGAKAARGGFTQENTHINNTKSNIVQKQEVATPENEVEEPTIHTVAAGENLGIIARRYNVTVAQITELNGITNPNSIRVGQQITIPNRAVAAETETETETEAEEVTHSLEDLNEDFKNPLINSNTALQNLTLIIQSFENEGHTDDRQLAYIIATTMHETGDTFHAIHEGFGARSNDAQGNPRDDYWREDYADSGYWGRGFVQLTWEDNYENMADLDNIQVELTTYNEAAILPAISAIVTVHGMTSSTSGENFTGRHLDQYIQTTTDPQTGEEVEGNADWYNARRTVNGTDGAADISTEAQAINRHIQAYRTGQADGSITKSLALYLFEDTTAFTNTKEADALRILHGVGHLEEQQSPRFNQPTDQKEAYQNDISETGDFRYLRNINTNVEKEALIAFQQQFNRDHNIEVPLNEEGVLDDPTYEALMLGGNRIATGTNMINHAFGGEVDATNLIDQAYDQYIQGTINISDLATRLISYMPSQTPELILNVFNCIAPNLALELAYHMSSNAPSHNELAYFNPEVLVRVQEELLRHPEVCRGECNDNSVYSVEYDRVQSVINYVAPEPEFRMHIVASGETLGAIAAQYGITVAQISEINGITNPNSLRVGQQLRIPNTPAPTEETNTTAPIEQPQPNENTNQREHVVASGETLGAIAAQYGTTVDAIVQLNELVNPNAIRVGQQLIIPAD